MKRFNKYFVYFGLVVLATIYLYTAFSLTSSFRESYDLLDDGGGIAVRTEKDIVDPENRFIEVLRGSRLDDRVRIMNYSDVARTFDVTLVPVDEETRERELRDDEFNLSSYFSAFPSSIKAEPRSATYFNYSLDFSEGMSLGKYNYALKLLEVGQAPLEEEQDDLNSSIKLELILQLITKKTFNVVDEFEGEKQYSINNIGDPFAINSRFVMLNSLIFISTLVLLIIIIYYSDRYIFKK